MLYFKNKFHYLCFAMPPINWNIDSRGWELEAFIHELKSQLHPQRVYCLLRRIILRTDTGRTCESNKRTFILKSSEKPSSGAGDESTPLKHTNFFVTSYLTKAVSTNKGMHEVLNDMW